MPVNHIETRVDSIGLRDGFRINAYKSIDDILEDLGGKSENVVEIVNAYCWQKGALVKARDQFTDDLEKRTQFARLTKTETKTVDGKEVTKTLPDETEKDYVNRFRKAVLEKTFTLDGVTDEASLEAWLQALADERTYTCDAKTAERAVKEKKIPEYALSAAKQIIGNGSQDKWAKTFTKLGLPFSPFNTSDNSQNEKNLALAVIEHQKYLAKNQYQ